MKIAVAGGFGFLGGHVVRRLHAKGYDVLPFSRRTGVDIRALDQVLGFLSRERPQVVVNCAAHVGGIAYNALHPTEVYEDNLLIGFHLLRACHQAGVGKLVNVMPNCTYPGVAEVYREEDWWAGPMHETVLTYGMPRKAVWAHCWAYKEQYAFNSVHLILPNLYGPGDHFDPIRSHALGALVRKIVDAGLSGRRTVEVWGSGAPVREWGYVEDAAEGIAWALEAYDEIEVLNIGRGEGCTIRALAEMIRTAAGWEGEFTFDRSRPDGAPVKVLDVGKMRRVLGWTPQTPLHEGIAKTVRWYTAEALAGRASR